jgi:cytochrome c
VIRAAAVVVVPLTLLFLLPSVAASDPVHGERVFQRCYACHSVAPGEDNLAGPNLRCILGRRAGTLPGFRFSPAMSEAGVIRGLVWTREALDAFLIDPQRVIPGTAMWIPELAVPEDRRDLIDYLEHVASCPANTR